MSPPAADTPTRQRLLDAGTELFLGQGFDATSLDQVRQRAGVSNGSLYHHFPSKAHLARALYLDALASYHGQVVPALDGDPPADDGVRALVQRHVDWVLARPAAARVLGELRTATRIDGRWPDWSQANAEPFARLERWIAREVAAGRMRAMGFDLWLALVLSPVMARTEAWLRLAEPAVPADEREWLAQAAARAVTLDPPTSRRGRR